MRHLRVGKNNGLVLRASKQVKMRGRTHSDKSKTFLYVYLYYGALHSDLPCQIDSSNWSFLSNWITDTLVAQKSWFHFKYRCEQFQENLQLEWNILSTWLNISILNRVSEKWFECWKTYTARSCLSWHGDQQVPNGFNVFKLCPVNTNICTSPLKFEYWVFHTSINKCRKTSHPKYWI